MCVIEHPAVRRRGTVRVVEALKKLQREYEETQRKLVFPLSLEDLEELGKHSQAIRRAAKAVARELNLSGDHWFTT